MKGFGCGLVVMFLVSAGWTVHASAQVSSAEIPDREEESEKGVDGFVRSYRFFVEPPFSGLTEVGIPMIGVSAALEFPVALTINVGGRLGVPMFSANSWGVDARLGWAPTLYEWDGSRENEGIHFNLIVLSGYRFARVDGLEDFFGSDEEKNIQTHNLALDAGIEVEVWGPDGHGWVIRLLSRNNLVLAGEKTDCAPGECPAFESGAFRPGVSFSVGYVF